MTESTTPALPEGFEYCTTWSRRKRHISADLTADRKKGRGGNTLCSTYGADQERAQAELDIWGSGKRVDVMALPLCGRCAKSKRVQA